MAEVKSNYKKIVSEDIVWSSEAKNKLGLPYLQAINWVYEDGTTYTFCRRANKDSLKFVLVDLEKNLIGVLDSVKPLKENNQNYLSVFGESLDELNEDRLKALARGLKEEAGYKPETCQVKKIGEFLLNSSMDEVATLYVVNISKAEKIERGLEEGEVAHTTMWLDKEEDILNRCDALVQTAYLHLIKGVKGFNLK